MKKDLIFYAFVALFFFVILFSVRYIVNVTRIFVDFEEKISPIEIFWEIDSNDSILRIKEPIYMSNNYFLCDKQRDKFTLNKDSVLLNEINNEFTENKGSILNLKPPYVLWKSAQNDTVKVFKNEKLLMFVRSN
ncbi:hypothetical protein [Faecalibacter macacae]|uniref:Uncharacterized protein n=1 Tax=Faecalibacter macacae TaxID=1859289 RepID=A0A3L9MFN4_9FLAO|nr:hypothetical protein [Faecalibacter macacae]RLZ11622.1 hypothetical protein EAH69_04165 [Faecalibacter macacae]